MFINSVIARRRRRRSNLFRGQRGTVEFNCPHKFKAQSTLEFTFAVVVVALLIYGLLRVFRWTGMDYAEHSPAQFQQFTDPDPNNLGGDNFVQFEQAQLNYVAADRTQRIGAFTRKY